jgi:hypothetical protein
MAGVHRESNLDADTRGGAKGLDSLRIARAMRVPAGVQLYRTSAELTRPFDGADVRGYEEARADSGRREPGQAFREAAPIGGNVQPTLSRDLLSPLWNERHLVWPKPLGDRQHLVGAGHLKVEHGTDLPCQTLDIVVLDVPAVLAEVSRDAVGAGALTQRGCVDRVRLSAPPRLTDCGHVIDVDVEPLVSESGRGELTSVRRSGVWHRSRPSHIQTHTGVEIEPVMKKLSIALVLVAACHSGAANPAPAVYPAGAPFASGSGGATSARAAVAGFLAAARNEDLQAMASIWGTTAGPARITIPREELEKRELIMMCFLRHDRYSLVSDAGSTAGQRRIEVELEQGMLVRKTTFIVVPGADNRWYVQSFDMEPVRDFCVKK